MKPQRTDAKQTTQEFIDWLDRTTDPLEAESRQARLDREAAEAASKYRAAAQSGPRPAPEAERTSSARLAQPAQAFDPARDPQKLSADDVDPAGAQLEGPLARMFMLAGNAIFTVVSKKTMTRFTFRLSRPDPDPAKDQEHRIRYGTPRRVPIFVAVLSGPENTSDYTYLGQLWQDAEKFTYSVGRKSRVGADAPSQKAATWLALALNFPEKLSQCEIWHEGRCGRCGRRLTVPSSIESGIGPECATKMGGF